MQPLREKIIEILQQVESYEVMADKILALMPGWISTRERLPSPGERVLCNSLIFGVQIGWMKSTHTWEFCNGGTAFNIDKWQPLPTPSPPELNSD